MNLIAGVIGCGNIARFHFSGLEKAGVRVKWVCDLNEQAARPWAQKFSAAVTCDYREIIRDPDVDLMVATANSSVHKPICLAAIESGKAVICEKTLATCAADALEVVRRAEEKQTIFYTSYMKRFITAVEKAKELLPNLGQIISMHIRTYQPWGELWNANPPGGFFHTPPSGMSAVRKNYGGGILVCGGSHLLDLILFFLGRPRRVFANLHTPADRDYDLHAAAILETQNGVAHLDAVAHPLKYIGFLRDGWDERIELVGTRGTLEIFSAMWDQPDRKASLLRHYDNTEGNTTEYRFDPVSPFDRAVAFFCRNIAHRTQGSQSRITGYEVDELIEAIGQSASQGRAIEIPWRL